MIRKNEDFLTSRQVLSKIVLSQNKVSTGGKMCKDIFEKFVLPLMFILAISISKAKAQEELQDLTQLSLEQLMNIEITSVSKKPEKLSQAPAAIYVITSDDIKRSGATSIPELLRMVPGLDIARINSNSWAISIRGFNGRFANKLLVLIDGRSVYTPTFSGVFWNEQDLLLQDIKRIEIIRGPGGTLWGANAVNGIINIITKDAKDTTGFLTSITYGKYNRPIIALRYGKKLSKGIYFRIWTKYFYRSSFKTIFGDNAHDNWVMYRGGFRVDVERSKENRLTLEGDCYAGSSGENMQMQSAILPKHDKHLGGSLLLKWKHTFSSDSDMKFQLYYQHTYRREAYQYIDANKTLSSINATAIISQILSGSLDVNTLIANAYKGNSAFISKIDIYNVDYQHRFVFKLWKRHELIYGLGLKVIKDFFKNDDINFYITPAKRTVLIKSGFVQDQIFLIPDRFSLIGGVKLEDNDFTGFEVQPNVRGLFFINPNHTLWGAISRAVRTPSRYEKDVVVTRGFYPDPTTGTVYVYQIKGGGKDLKSEDLTAYELGYRGNFKNSVFLDLTLFYNKYNNLIMYQNQGISKTEIINLFRVKYISLIHTNGMEGSSYGFEGILKIKPQNWWSLKFIYSYLKLNIELKPNYNDQDTLARINGSSPRHQFAIGSSFNFRNKVFLDTYLYYVDKLPYTYDLPKIDSQIYGNIPHVPSYVDFNANIIWKVNKHIEISLTGKNLFHKQHLEFVSVIQRTIPTEIPRMIYGKIEVKF